MLSFLLLMINYKINNLGVLVWNTLNSKSIVKRTQLIMRRIIFWTSDNSFKHHTRSHFFRGIYLYSFRLHWLRGNLNWLLDFSMRQNYPRPLFSAMFNKDRTFISVDIKRHIFSLRILRSLLTFPMKYLLITQIHPLFPSSLRASLVCKTCLFQFDKDFLWISLLEVYFFMKNIFYPLAFVANDWKKLLWSRYQRQFLFVHFETLIRRHWARFHFPFICMRIK